MARTTAGAELTEQHRRAQVSLRARALQAYLLLWPLWNGDEDSFQRLVDATLPLIQVYGQVSATLTNSYLEGFRSAEGVQGRFTPILAPAIDPDRARASLVVTGREQTRDAIASGQSPEVAMQTALVRTSGTVTRQVLAPGRETLIESVKADPETQGWCRVTDSNPCAFCALLASRGPAYGAETVKFEAHDHCTCHGEPAYAGAKWPGRAKEFRAIYEEHAKGTDNPLNEFRRVLEGRV